MGWITVNSETPGAVKDAIVASGRVPEPVLAAGQLRQGKAPSTMGMVTGAALIEVVRPRRSKKLPRHFVLVATPDEVIAFSASGGTPEGHGPYELRIGEQEKARFPRSAVLLTGLEEGEKSKGGTLTVDGESFPVCRPNLTGEANTDELLAVLAGGG